MVFCANSRKKNEKLACLTLAVLMVLSLCACGGVDKTVMSADYICYESTVGTFVGETGDELVQHFVRMLEEHRAG